MGQFEKLLISVLCGSRDKDIRFDDLCMVLAGLGFSEQIKGSHHIFHKDGIDEIINIQPEQAQPQSVFAMGSGTMNELCTKYG